MAQVHPNATIAPTKIEIARDWLVQQAWFDGEPAGLESPRRFSYRFDDPGGEVGVEVLLVTDGDRVLQVPLTYRAEPRPGGGFLTEMDHSVLGRRFVYDGLTDPVLVAALMTAALTGGQQEDYEVGDEVHPAVVKVRGTGPGAAPGDVVLEAVVRTGALTEVRTSVGDLVFPHVVGAVERADRPALVASWPEGPTKAVVAVLGPGRRG